MFWCGKCEGIPSQANTASLAPVNCELQGTVQGVHSSTWNIQKLFLWCIDWLSVASILRIPFLTHGYAVVSQIVQAEYVKSSASVEQCPEENGAEFAVVGRSNVGKSSLINMLTGRRSLALVSKTPGEYCCDWATLLLSGCYRLHLTRE